MDGGEWSASRPGPFAAGTHLTGGWANPRTGLDAVTKEKAPAYAVVQAVAVTILTELPRLLLLLHTICIFCLHLAL